jgi:hypothetical protein
MKPLDDKVRYVSHDDEIDYANLLKKRADRCFDATGYPILEERTITAFKRALTFEAQGLRFKTRIREYEAELKKNYKEKKIEIKKEFNNRDYYKNANKSKVRYYLHDWYWSSFLEFLLELLAEHRALMKAKDYVEEGEELKSSSLST